MARVKEAPTLNAFRVEPPDDDDDEGAYEGWLPVEDELDDTPDAEGRLHLEAFIREMLSAV